MKTKLLLLGLLAMLFTMDTMAQSSEIEIIKNKYLPTTYQKCDIELSKEQFINLFKDDPNMTDYYKSLSLNYASDALLSASAGVLIFWPVTQKIQKNDPDWYLAIIGAGCFALSIPFKLNFHKKAQKAVQVYNSGLRKNESVHFNLQMNQNGLGLVMKF